MESSDPLLNTEAQRKELGKQKRHWVSVFRRVMSSYHEHLSTRCSAGVFNYGQSSKGCSASTAGVVRATSSDFICDVETSARAGLTKRELSFFETVYRYEDELATDRLIAKHGLDYFNEYKKNIQVKMAKVFESRGVYPVFAYFKPKDVR